MNEFQIKNEHGEPVGVLCCKEIEPTNGDRMFDRLFVIFPNNSCALLYLHTGWSVEKMTK